MTQLDAAIAEFQKTIAELGIRLANAAITIQGLQERNADLEKQVESLKTSGDGSAAGQGQERATL